MIATHRRVDEEADPVPVDPGGLEFSGFDIEQIGKGHGHVGPGFIMGVGDGVADGHGAGQGEFQFAVGMRSGEADVIQVNGLRPGNRPGNGRHLNGIAVGTDAHGRFLLPIDSQDVLSSVKYDWQDIKINVF